MWAGLMNKLKLSTSSFLPNIQRSGSSLRTDSTGSRSSAGMCTSSPADEHGEISISKADLKKQERIDKLKAEFNRFILANGHENGLGHLDDLLERKMRIDCQIREFVNAFTKYRLGEKRSMAQTMMEVAKLYFLLQNYQKSAKTASDAAEWAIKDFVAKIQPDYFDEIESTEFSEPKLNVHSSRQMSTLFLCLFLGRDMPGYEGKSMAGAWRAVEDCRYHMDDGSFNTKLDKLEGVAKLISALEQMPVDDAVKRGFEEFEEASAHD